jgi:hypothetical protein
VARPNMRFVPVQRSSRRIGRVQDLRRAAPHSQTQIRDLLVEFSLIVPPGHLVIFYDEKARVLAPGWLQLRSPHLRRECQYPPVEQTPLVQARFPRSP